MPTDTIDSAIFLRILQQERLKNARRVNLLRFRAVSLFLAANATVIILQEVSPASVSRFPPLICYWLMATAIWLASRSSTRLARFGSIGIPVIDMPVVFWLQYSALAAPSSKVAPVALAEITVGVYVALIVLAMLSLERWDILLAATVASIFALILETLADSALFAKISTVLLIGAAMMACLYARHRIIDLIQATTKEQVRRQRLRRYFSPEVAEIVENQGDEALRGRRFEITVLFCDLRDFTKLSDAIDPQEVFELLNEYLARMTEQVFAHGGTLDKFLGDGLMAYFGAPVRQDDHADRAVRCATAMHEALRHINMRRKTNGEAPLGMGIGIHTGSAIAGSIGTTTRREYTVIGATVNVASRLETLTKDYKVPTLISDCTARFVSEAVQLRAVGSAQIRGCAQPMRLYTPCLPARQDS
ncbi:MAG: adenylate/guanylate cyclase domain-containing protein [Phycisphaerales bacterium]